MIRKIAVFVIRFLICLVILTAVSLLGSGCGTFGTIDESLYGPYGSAHRNVYRGYRHNIPVPPPRIGFNRPPVHFNESIFSFRIINETQKMHVRCIIDGQEHQRTIRGQILRAYIRTERGIETAALIPPGETSYLMFDGESHNMRCELYSGPVQVAPDGSYIFKKVREKWFRNFLPEKKFPRGEYKITNLKVLGYDRI